jgi:hypothetical protein
MLQAKRQQAGDWQGLIYRVDLAAHDLPSRESFLDHLNPIQGACQAAIAVPLVIARKSPSPASDCASFRQPELGPVETHNHPQPPSPCGLRPP